jgi:hypothetical protein
MPSNLRQTRCVIVAFVFAFTALAAANTLMAANPLLTPLCFFSLTNGATPWASVIQASDGNFYGTTYAGGAATNFDNNAGAIGYGTVFKVTPNGQLTCLASFFKTNGMHPRAALVEADDGNFYGTTHNGGSWPGTILGNSGAGTVFRVTRDGQMTLMVDFAATNGACPAAGLVKGPDGALYGVTRMGGSTYGDPASGLSAGWGVIFRLTTNGVFQVIHHFLGHSDGGAPMSPLVLAKDGNMYGINNGNFFSVSVDGAHSVLQALDSFSAGLSAPVEARDGTFYGVSQVFGEYNYGAVIKLTRTSQSALASITVPGGIPWGAVVEGTDGNLYGTYSSSSLCPQGFIYRATPAGQLETIAAFDGTNGMYPRCGLIQARDGNFYGTAGGGPASYDGYGVVFKLTVPSADASRIFSVTSSAFGTKLRWSALRGRSYRVQSTSNLIQPDWQDVGTDVTASDNVAEYTDSQGAAGPRFFRIALLPAGN